MKTLELNESEMRLVVMALVCPNMKDFVQGPATPYAVRQIYKELLEKVKNAKEKGRIIMPS